MDEQALASAAGATVDEVREMVVLGIVTPSGEAFRPPDIQRVRIAKALDASGISLSDLGRMIADGHYSMGWADPLFPDPIAMSGRTLRQLCDELGMPLDIAHRLFTVAWQLPSPGDDEEVREDDAEMLRLAAMALVAFGGEDAILAGTRYLGDNLRRMAESQMRFFRQTIEEPLFASGRPIHEVMDQIAMLGVPLVEAGFRAGHLLHRRHLEHFEIEDIVANTELAMQQAGMTQPAPARPPAIAFLDLTGYTGITEERGDREAAALTERLSELVTHEADHHGGRAVKFLGDGVMFHFPTIAGSVLCLLDLVARTPELGLPPSHAGVNAGPVVFRDGDYFGRTVNLAARVCDRAGAGEVMATLEVAEGCDHPDLAFESAGPAALKGIAEPVELFRVRRSAGQPRTPASGSTG